MKKLFFALAFGAVSLLAIRPVHAAGFGDLVKGSGPTVYYVTSDQKRLAFPDEATFRSWYADFSPVRTVSDDELSQLPFAGQVPLRPGSRPIKGASEARIYGIDRDGNLRWLSTEGIARMIYGDDWNRKIAVVPDTALAEYGRGADVTGPNQFWWKAERDASPNLQEANARRSASAASPAKPSVANPAVTPAASSTAPTRIIILPTVINDDGGHGKEGDVDYLINGALVMPQDGINVLPGSYTIYHGQFPGYAASAWSGDCSADGVVTVPANQTRACFITFNDIPDATFGSKSNQPPKLTLFSYVQNHHGGTARDQDIKLFIGSMQVTSGQPSTLSPNDYTVYRVVPQGYAAYDWGGDCSPKGTVALRNGDDKTCTITLHD